MRFSVWWRKRRVNMVGEAKFANSVPCALLPVGRESACRTAASRLEAHFDRCCVSRERQKRAEGNTCNTSKANQLIQSFL